MEDVIVRVIPTATDAGRGKLADVELHFVAGALEGLKLVGFAIWQRRRPADRTVTLPARSYSANGQHRSFALLRPISDPSTQQRVRVAILNAYAQSEQQIADVEQAS